MDVNERVKLIDEEIARLRSGIAELKALRKSRFEDTAKAYIGTLIASAQKTVAWQIASKKSLTNTRVRERRQERVLKIAEALHLSLRDHLPSNFDPSLLLQAAENVDERVIGAASAKAVNARHGRTGGAKDKATKLLAAWATGKYRTKAECAEKAGASLQMSFKTAQNALRNAPKPT